MLTCQCPLFICHFPQKDAVEMKIIVKLANKSCLMPGVA